MQNFTDTTFLILINTANWHNKCSESLLMSLCLRTIEVAHLSKGLPFYHSLTLSGCRMTWMPSTDDWDCGNSSTTVMILKKKSIILTPSGAIKRSGSPPQKTENQHWKLTSKLVEKVWRKAFPKGDEGTTSQYERETRNNLRIITQAGKIVIKPADKGSATVIMSWEDYVTKAMQQLSKEEHYCQLDQEYTTQLTQLLRPLFCWWRSLDVPYTILYVRTAVFYLLPKIHKAGNPGQPIVSSRFPNLWITTYAHMLKPSFLISRAPQTSSWSCSQPTWSNRFWQRRTLFSMINTTFKSEA